MTPTKIVLHSTGCNNKTLRRYVAPHEGQTTGMMQILPSKQTYTRTQMINIIGKNSYSNDWNRIIYNPDGTERKVCVAGFIGTLKDGSIATIQTLPWTMKNWGVGSGKNGSYNSCAIQFEICEDNHKDADYCKKTFEEAAELCAYLMKQYPTITEVVSHDEAHDRGYGSNHNDPTNWWPKHKLTMDMFRARVKELLGGTTEEKPATNTVTFHVVTSTDTLTSIARKYNTTVSELVKLNNIKNPDIIYDGQIIKLPGYKETDIIKPDTYTLKEFIVDVQRAIGVDDDGIAGPITIGATVTVSSRINKKHAVVVPIQKRLYALGYTEVGDADGSAGPKFTKAVKRFQKDNGCFTDGEITKQNRTWRKLLGMI